MAGKNRYLEVRQEYGHLKESREKRASVETRPTEPCIFLSHRSTDKEAVKAIGKHIMSRGIDVYLDVDDPNLQDAVERNDHKAITAAIELGIANSTDLLAFLTKNSMSKESSSVWVPYEIGYAKRQGNRLAALKSKDLPSLPSYLEVVRRITGISSLKSYLQEIQPSKQLFVKGSSEKVETIVERIKQAFVEQELSPYLDAQ